MLDYDSGDNVSIRANERFYFIFVFSGYHLLIKDNIAPIYCLDKNVNDDILGETVNIALNQCRVINPYESPEFFDSEKVMSNQREWIFQLIEKYRFKNKKALFQRMMACNLERNHGVITVTPTLHKKLELWTRDGFTDDDNIILSEAVSNEELGKAVKECMSRCRNSV